MTTRSLQGTTRRTTRSSRKSPNRGGDGPASGHPVHAVVDRTRGNGNGSLTQEERLAYGLGWLGIGLGLAELMMPRRLARTTGIPSRYRRLIRIMGLREIASGLGIVAQRKPAGAVWSRVAGDVIDLACLGVAFTSARADRRKLAGAVTAIAGATALDLLCAQQLTRGAETRNGALPVTVSLIIDRSPEDLYGYWHVFSNFPSFMKHVISVEQKGERCSHWVVTGPAGSTVEWDAEITEDVPNKMIAWRAVEGSDVDHNGQVRFEPAPGRRGTMVTVDMQYRPPAGTLGSAVAAWFGENPERSVTMDLRRFKQVMEAGEVITTEGQPAGRPSSTSWKYDRAVRR
jgi:uncharacterized membrane protein